MTSSGFSKPWPAMNRKPPVIFEKSWKSTPVTDENMPVGSISTPVARATCGCLRRNGTSFSVMLPLSPMMELPGGRTRMSAPTPRERRAWSSSMPRLRPTSVSTMVTCTPMAMVLSSVRTGRCFRFSTTSLLIKSGGPRRGSYVLNCIDAPLRGPLRRWLHQPEIDLDGGGHGHRLPVFGGRQEPPLTHRVDAVLIQAKSDAGDDVRVVHQPVGADNNVEHLRAL